MQKENEPQHDPKAASTSRSSSVLSVILPCAYLAVLALFCVYYSVMPGPEFLVLCFFIYAAYNKWSRKFVKDWIPFLILFMSYQAMYGLVGTVAGIVHVSEPINAELQLFGSIPTVTLQQFYRSPILDYMGAVFYSVHFFAPTIFAFYMWRINPNNYWKYTGALAILTYSALITFLVYPVAPPWYGVNGVTKVLFDVDTSIGAPIYHTIYDFIEPNKFAAFPSLHSAFPMLITLYAFKVEKLRALPILIFPFGVWFSAVYLGEHYIVDVLGGIAYAALAFFIIEKLIPYVQAKRSLKQTSELSNQRKGAFWKIFDREKNKDGN